VLAWESRFAAARKQAPEGPSLLLRKYGETMIPK